MKAPFFTVLVDSYNYGQYVEEAVASALGQNFPTNEREILVVDDGSTDDTETRMRKYRGAIRYIRKENGGQASAFNFGFAHARGEVIALLDADDVWLPEKLERVHEEFERHPEAGMLYHRVHLWDGARDVSEDPYFVALSGRIPESRSTLLKYPMVGTSCLAFRRQTLQEILPVAEGLRFQADAYLTALIIFVAPIVALPEFLGKYRLHGDNLFQANSDQTSKPQLERRMVMRQTLLCEIEKWLRDHGRRVDSTAIRAYLKQWTLAQEKDAFALEPPGRWKHFRHLLQFPRTYGEIMTPRHRTYSYLRAIATLFLGYHHLHVFDDVRAWSKKKLASPVGNNVVARDKPRAFAARS